MPIYEYECPKCGVFEVEQRISEDALKVCPQCAQKGDPQKIERIISATAFHLKGGGWYKSDYSSKKPASTDSGSASTATTTESAPAKTESTEKASLKTAPSSSCGTGCGCGKK